MYLQSLCRYRIFSVLIRLLRRLKKQPGRNLAIEYRCRNVCEKFFSYRFLAWFLAKRKHQRIYTTIEKAVSAIPAGLKCETRYKWENLLAFIPVLNFYLLLMMKDLNCSSKEGQSTGTFNSVVFHPNSTVDFDFARISDVSMTMPVTVCRERSPKFCCYTFQHFF